MADKCSKCNLEISQAKDMIKCKECSVIVHKMCSGDTQKKGIRNAWKCEGCVTESSSTGSRASESAQSEVLQAIYSFRKENNERWDQQTEKLSKMQEDITSVVADVTALKDQCSKLQIATDNTGVKVNHLQEENKKLCSEVNVLKQALSDLEQHTRKSNIVITGVPTTPREDIFGILDSIARVLNVRFEHGDVSAAHRLPARRDGNMSQPIVVCFVSRAIKMQWIVARRRVRTISARDLHTTFSDTRIYINEHLTTENRGLFNAARSLLKNGKLTSVWTNECRVLAKKTDNGVPIRIRSLSQLYDLGLEEQGSQQERNSPSQQ